MSHGCSGDIWRRDYTQKPPYKDQEWTVTGYAESLLNIVESGLKTIQYNAQADLAMAEARMKLNYRVPDAQRLQWAKKIVETMARPSAEDHGGGLRSRAGDSRRAEVDGDRGSGPADRRHRDRYDTHETYALTGLKLKLRSPLPQTMVIDLANGGDGYIRRLSSMCWADITPGPRGLLGWKFRLSLRSQLRGLKLLEHVAAKPRRFTSSRRRPAARRSSI